MKAFLLGAVAAMSLSAAANASTIIYQNDFEGGSTAGFTGSTGINNANSGVTHFMGPWSQSSGADLTLNTAGLGSITLNFDLYTLHSLDGDGTTLCCGPDPFLLSVNGSTTLLNATFSNNSGWYQSYGAGPGGTGSDPALTGVLGYNYYGPDHTYHLSFVVPVSGSSTVINFVGASSQGWNDEGYAIDNVVVSGTAATGGVPEPATWAMMLIGVFGLGAALRRRQQMLAA